MSEGGGRRTVFVHEFVTGGGLAGAELTPSWAAEGRAMRRALAEDFAALDGVRVLMTLDGRLPDEPGPWTTLRVGPGEELETFRRVAANADHTLVVAPETGGILEERATILERIGARSLGSTAEAIALTGRKDRLARHLAEAGLPTPPSRVVCGGDVSQADVPFPAVLKPIDGAGALDTFLVRDADELRRRAAPGREWLVQPFVAGTPLSAAFLVPRPGDPILVGVGRQLVSAEDGRLSYRGGTVPEGRPEWGETARRAVASVPGLQGWIGVDFLRDASTGDVSILEINPRPTTSYVGYRRLLPPAALARLWLAGCGDRADGASLATLVHSQAPRTFAADGR